MPSVNSSYKLKRLLSSRDPDFAAALLLYVRNTAPGVRTDTNEIAYWLDEFAKRFGDPFYVFGFFRDRQLVGFAEAAYLRAERLFALDYIVIDEAYRRNNVFFEFVDHLKRHLEESHPEYRYGIVEVCYGLGETCPPPSSCLLTRLLKIQGFHVIHAPYYQPRLRLDDAESEMQGDLLIYSPSPINAIQTETYLAIVRALYYKYYLPWKSLEETTADSYKKHIDRLFGKVEASVKKRKSISVNGHHTLLAAPDPKNVIQIGRAHV